MRVAWLPLLVAFYGSLGPKWCRGLDTLFSSEGSDGDILDLAITNRWVYVVTKDRLHQLSHNLTLLQTLSQRGTNAGAFKRTPEAGDGGAVFSVNTLVPFNGVLITCGAVGCVGYCELLDADNISRIVYAEKEVEVGPVISSRASLGFLVNINHHPKGNQTYLLSAVGSYKTACPKVLTIRLYNTDDNQTGKIFSFVDDTSNPEIRSESDVEFVDGFQIKSTIFLFAKVIDTDEVRLFWFEGKTNKKATFESLRGATINCKERHRLISASVIAPGDQSVLWAGIFAGNDSNDTELAIFDISPPNDGTDNLKHTWNQILVDKISLHRELKPKRVLLTNYLMTSVLAVKLKSWFILFIGTGDGQLLKLAVDRNFQAGCLSILWMADDGHQVFPKMHLDRKHVFFVIRNQLRHVEVSKCGNHSSLQACLSMHDPYCGWCDALKRCSFEDECDEHLWLSVPHDISQRRMLSHGYREDTDGAIKLIVNTNLGVGGTGVPPTFACHFFTSMEQPCNQTGLRQQYPQCTCLLPPFNGLNVTVTVSLGRVNVTDELNLINCSGIIGLPSSLLCHRCLKAGCGWSHSGCTWSSPGTMNMTVCQALDSGMDLPQILNITPGDLSVHGKNHALLTGRNLSHVTGVRIQREMDCSPKESPVWNNTGDRLRFHIPSGDKGQFRVCLLLLDGSCHGNSPITYHVSPACAFITPTSTWISGNRTITITGSNLAYVDAIVHGQTLRSITNPINSSFETLLYQSPAAERGQEPLSTVSLRVANLTLACPASVLNLPEPQFTTFTSTRIGDELLVTIQKKADELHMIQKEIAVWGSQGDVDRECVMKKIERSADTDFLICSIRNSPEAKIDSLKISYGDKTVPLEPDPASYIALLGLLGLLSIPLILVALTCIYRYQQRKLAEQMNKLIEDLELDIRNDIRQGFVDMQTEKSDLIENVGAIPFLDYKHFAARVFFPEDGTLIRSCIQDISQDARRVESDECCRALSRLIREQPFLTSMVHALEQQKGFTLRDKCTVASLLTVALHGDLAYLTQVMEELLKALMEQPSNAQPKLMLRRTESIVEKILTNWMSICLYGFLRESVGQHLFLLVSALAQQITKGPVDSVTGKALYTLSEDWLLWQAQDFASVKLQVLFAVGSDGEVSEPLEVSALSCDTVDQVKENILSTFRTKFGFSYNARNRDICLELERDGVFVALEEVDASSEVVGEFTMLNTLKHYRVPEKATVKVLSTNSHPPLRPQTSLKDDQDFDSKYFHLIDPDVDEDWTKKTKRKLKLKEVQLNKLLITKVAIHSFVETLFLGIWGGPLGIVPPAIKHFFDFLDAQAANMKITDPDVLHIWKTNSLPLRFWVNILKNPQFVFDMEKTPHLDTCLSVISQAFMDSFSLSETQLGKHGPTNKLLYAKDIPQFKQAVKTYYKRIGEQQPITSSEFKDFLLAESKKHENEFNEVAALQELYKFIQRYFTVINQKLEQNSAPAGLKEQLQHVKKLFDNLKSCSWN